MTDRLPPPSERELFASMLECARQGAEIRRRERRVTRWLGRRNLRLERDPSGYAISDRYSTLCEATGLTLAQAEMWAATVQSHEGGAA
ncbi:hypothetical protein ACQKQD_18455 [Methylobacterium sp. NPDC080182]|uniref:hypothetical protein n=1 Tax=Methylobacterium sp. NPDC080182 TaxID=3390590 RepID=UPI003D067078